MTSTNKPKRLALFLILFLAALGITLANATTEDNYKNDTNFLPRIFETTHTENGYKINIIINPTAIGIYAEENGFNLDLTINPQGIGGSHSENNYQLDLIPEKNFPDISDLTVTDVTLSKTVVGQGFSCEINATVLNQGLYYETFYVTLYANTTTLKTQTITLTSKDYTTITFTWNTTSFAKSSYTISAYAVPVPGEFGTADNNCSDGTVILSIPGDINGDKTVNIHDLTALGEAYGSTPTSPNWNPNANINCDGVADVVDLAILGKNY